MYDYVGHLKKFEFEWNHNALGFKFEIKIDNSDSKKIKKNFFTKRYKNKYQYWSTWNFNNSAKDKSRISFLIGYIYTN